MASYDVGGLARLMVHWSEGEGDFAKGEVNRLIISRWMPETFTKGFARNVELAVVSVPIEYGSMDIFLMSALGL